MCVFRSSYPSISYFIHLLVIVCRLCVLLFCVLVMGCLSMSFCLFRLFLTSSTYLFLCGGSVVALCLNLMFSIVFIFVLNTKLCNVREKSTGIGKSCCFIYLLLFFSRYVAKKQLNDINSRTKRSTKITHSYKVNSLTLPLRLRTGGHCTVMNTSPSLLSWQKETDLFTHYKHAYRCHFRNTCDASVHVHALARWSRVEGNVRL